MENKLEELLENSYSPYSNFRVSAIVITKDNKEFKGVNVENISYGASICAERNAITSAISNGYKKCDFKELHIMCDTDKISSPCFLCRQVISELFDNNTKIILYNNKKEKETYTKEELCPFPFDSEDLRWKVDS